MDGLSTIRQREIDLANAEPLKIPNQRLRDIIERLVDDVDTYTSVTMPSTFDRREIELATFRGAFLALAMSKDPIAQRFAEKGLLAVNVGGLAALTAAFDSILDEPVRSENPMDHTQRGYVA